MKPDFRLVGILVLLGAGWGFTQPMSKIAVSTGRLPFGLIFWQFVIGAVVLTGVQAARRRPLPVNRNAVPVYLVIALLGTIIPMGTGYLAYRHLPSGIMSILVSFAPMMAFPIALALGADRFTWARLAGLGLGLAGVILLTVPQGSLSAENAGLWVLLGLVAPLMYAMEANYVGHWGTRGLGAIQVLHGACCVGMVLALVLAVVTGQFFIPVLPFGPADWALVAGSVLNAFAYSLYVWLVGRAGSTFAAQCGYLVTGFGVLWAIALLGERLSSGAWLALALVLSGVLLVQPRQTVGLAATVPDRENGPA